MLNCSEPSSNTKIKMYERVCGYACVYVRRGSRGGEEEKLRQAISLNYFLSIIIHNTIPFSPKTVSRDDGVTGGEQCKYIHINFGLIEVTAEKLLMISSSQDGEVAA